MLVELGPGTAPHPFCTVGIDPVHPVLAPEQHAQDGQWMRHDYSLMGGNQIRFLHDGEADAVYASHVLEHVRAGVARIAVFNEAWRVLRPGGTFTMLLPLVGYDGMGLVESYEAWADPTHVSHWWFPQSLLYFTGGMGADAHYGITPWEQMSSSPVPEGEVTALLHSERTTSYDTYNPRPGMSWWSVRGRWEGVARLVKPL